MFRGQWVDVFIIQDYKWLWDYIKPDTTVIDIGSHIGTMAFYFAMNPNVKKVLSYESNLFYANMAEKYITMSPLKEKIELTKKAITTTGESRRLPKSIYGNDFLSYNALLGTLIESVKFNEVVQGRKNMVIKCDISGGEKSLFKDADLSKVYAIEIECHKYLDKEIISEFRGKGFKTGYLVKPHDGVSIIKAWR